ncbi:MAG: hypothetical protein ACFFA8_01115 [Promethearchaeota archaeon]
MVIFLQKKILKSKILIRLTIFSTILIGILLSTSIFNNSLNLYKQQNKYSELRNLKISDSDSPLFEGLEDSLNITDYGNLHKLSDDIEVTNQDQVNLTYYLDDVHDWKVSMINSSISNIKDTRNWVNNSGFQLPNIFRKYLPIPLETPHNYSQNNNPNPSSPEDYINEPSALYMRAHFVNFSFEPDYDYMYVYDALNEVYYVNDSSGYDVYTPWIPGNWIKFDYESDNIIQYYGYYIDYYEFINESSNLEINSNWGFNYDQIGTTGKNYYGIGEIENTTAAYVATYADYIDYNEFSYEDNAFSEIYQNFTVPRKAITEAYVSFDYYCEFGLETNDNYIYVAINNQKIYSKGMGEIYDQGKRSWHKSGKITMDLWDNTSDIFDSDVQYQTFNISIGFKIDIGWTYTNSPDGLLNFIWFDNVSLVLNSIANSSQSDIMLKINSENPIEGNLWGESHISLNSLWESNPIILNLSTISPSLTLDLNTTLVGYHNAKTMINQQNEQGLRYNILKNGTIIWEFFHNLYMPSQYSDFNVIIEKPINWDFKSVLDPTLFDVEFEGGNYGDDFLKINSTYALYPGWWSFIATSPNYLNLENTKLLKQGVWTGTTFNTGESTVIKTQVNYSNEIPANLDSTSVNFTVYDPDGLMWFTEEKAPLLNGTVFFSELYFDALNTTGGQYDYTLFWSNGTSLGGLNSSFLVVHESSFSLLKPNDAIFDLIADAFVGDIIPVRIKLIDSENNNSISNAIISYNWTSGTLLFEEAALGIYEAILDTSDLGSNGFYEILIESSKVGFLDYNLTLKINIGEETSLQRIQSDYDIELHANSTIKFRYYSLFDGEGIDGANIAVNITNPDLYHITNSLGGYYDIEFNTSFINELGIFQLDFNFSAPAFEPQTHIYQFEIIEQSVIISTYIDNVEITQNSIVEVTYMEKLNVSVKSRAIIDNNFLTGGNFTWISNSYQQTLNEYADYWYNASIEINPSIYSPSLNLVTLRFEMEKYQTESFYFQLLVYEQPVNLSVYLNSEQISENQLKEVMFKQNLTISVKAYGDMELDFIDNADIYWISENYLNNFIEYGDNWYNLSFILSSSNFSSGVNTVSIKFEKQNYTTTYFSFQLLVKEQSVQVNASINSAPILENALIEVMFKENITIAAQAYAMGEGIYLSGGNITLIGEYSTFNLYEEISNPSWFTTSIIIDGAYFDLGINTVSIRFKQENYTEAYFSFQFFIVAETVNLSLYVNSNQILPNNLTQVTYYDEFSLSLKALANSEKIFLEGGSATFVIGSHSQDFNENANFWYNTSIFCDPSYFDLGVNIVYVQFNHPNYTSSTFHFLILVNQIDMNALTIDFQDTIESYSGDILTIRINLTESVSANIIENATISYSWKFGLGNFEYLGNGIYEVDLYIPDNVQGSYKVSLIISSDNVLYKAKQTSFIAVISAKQLPNFILWIVLIGLAILISVLGSLSIRSYVIIPRRKKKEAKLLSRTQRFKDLKNIQAIVVIHKLSGIPLYSKSYSILEKQKKELFSGFIQAITTIGEEIAGKGQITEDSDEITVVEKILELDFKYFDCLICDQGDIRIVLVLKEKASDRLKEIIANFSMGLTLQLSRQIENWDGSLDMFETLIPPILENYIELFYKEPFELNSPEYIAQMRKEMELTSMETRVLNVIYSMVKTKNSFYLDYLLEAIHEQNKDKVIDALENLIERKLIISAKK